MLMIWEKDVLPKMQCVVNLITFLTGECMNFFFDTPPRKKSVGFLQLF